MNAPRMQTPAAALLCTAALLVAALSSCEGTKKLLETGGDIAADATGEEDYRNLGSALGRSLDSYDDLLPAEEKTIGHAVSAQILANPDLAPIDDDEITRYVNLVGLTLALSSDAVRQTYDGYRFIVVDSTELNAFAAPGGYVFVTTAMLARTENEEELAGVLAHEIAHVTLKHGLQAIDQSNLVQAGQAVTRLVQKHEDDEKLDKRLKQAQKAFGKSADEVVFTLLSGGYGADKERAADLLAARILADANYDPRGLSAFLEDMPSGSGRGWLATHPEPQERVANLRGAATGEADMAAIETRAARHAAALAKLRRQP